MNNSQSATATEKEFNFIMDEKHTVWYRTQFSVNANNREEAEKIAIEMYKSGEAEQLPNNIKETEILLDTLQPMTIKESQGETLLEMACNNDDQLDFKPVL